MYRRQVQLASSPSSSTLCSISPLVDTVCALAGGEETDLLASERRHLEHLHEDFEARWVRTDGGQTRSC
jgi:hypothetical protein